MRMFNNKIRVLHITNSLNYGGLERVVIDICRHLDPIEFEPMVACLKWKGPQSKLLEDIGIPVFQLKKEGSKLAKYSTFLVLRKIIREYKIDVIHTHNTGPLLEAMLARVMSFSFPQIIHTDHTRARWPDKKRYMWFERIASKYVHSMIAVSIEGKEKLVQFEHIAGNRIEIVDNGIPVDDFQVNTTVAAELKKELNLDTFRYVIGLCVVLRKQKGIVHLLNALPDIIKACPDLVCVIGGGGPEKEELERHAAALHLGNNIRFIGPRDDVGKVLSLFDIYILPSEWEGLPLSLLEAMAAQRCIVATAVGGVPKALENGGCGVLVPPGNPTALSEAVIGLLESSEKRKQLAAEAYRCVSEKYSATVMARNYGLLYKQSLEVQRK
jgi:glycosyltransferase involved in cell wall biosynthesis